MPDPQCRQCFGAGYYERPENDEPGVLKLWYDDKGLIPWRRFPCDCQPRLEVVS
jgi:hypothetical protein